MTADLQQLSAPSRRRWASDHRHVPPESQARRPDPGWWQTCAPREAVLQRTLALPFTGDSDANLKTRERGLIKLLDWLEDQPGGNWQERWLASGAEAAGRDWKRVPVKWLTARDHARKYDTIDLVGGMIPLIGGQVIRPNYQWLLRLIPSHLLSQFRRVTDPEGFAALEAHCEATGRRGVNDRAQALNRITWIMIRKGGLIKDITIGDCVELQDGIGEHQCAGQHGKHLYYALLAETGVFGQGAPPRLKAVMVLGQRSPAELIDRHEITCRPIRDLLVDYLTDRTVDVDYVTLEDMARSLGLLFWKDLEQHHPGISSLRLDAQTAAAWKERVSVVPSRGSQPARPPHQRAHRAQLRPGLLPGPGAVGRRRSGPLGTVGGALPDPRQGDLPRQGPQPPQSEHGPADPHPAARATRPGRHRRATAPRRGPAARRRPRHPRGHGVRPGRRDLPAPRRRDDRLRLHPEHPHRAPPGPGR